MAMMAMLLFDLSNNYACMCRFDDHDSLTNSIHMKQSHVNHNNDIKIKCSIMYTQKGLTNLLSILYWTVSEGCW